MNIIGRYFENLLHIEYAVSVRDELEEEDKVYILQIVVEVGGKGCPGHENSDTGCDALSLSAKFPQKTQKLVLNRENYLYHSLLGRTSP